MVSAGSPTEEFGPYIVYEQLGVGGMAQVHRAIEIGSELPRPVALKRMLSHIAGSEEMVKSFVREARLASYLKHQNVAHTYDLGRVGEIYFIVMELITGRNLREVLRHCGTTTGPMPVPVALNILNQICDALDYAHNLCDEHGDPLGIIHRDVSPSNIIVSDTGVAKLIDFGIAKASGAGMQTLGGTLKGKFGYMAPEYLAGRIDARADLWAVGVIAHELLTNRPLFAGRDDIDTLTRVRDMHIDPPSKKNPQVPPEIDDVVMTALARDPDRRWQHATALRTAMTTLTHRLGLVASNAQMVQWLDWVFTQQKQARGAQDTEDDGNPLHDRSGDYIESLEAPSISIEEHTAQLVSIHRKPPGSPELVRTPLGVPAYNAQQVRSTSSVPVPRSSAQIPLGGTYPPDAGMYQRARSASQAPPPQQPASPAIGRTLFSTSAPMPVLPQANGLAPPGLFPTPRPARPSSPPPVSNASGAQRIPPPPPAGATAATGGHLKAVVLVVLAAALAAITVYFVLPLLTSG